MPRAIIHVDMDAFYASVEQLLRPSFYAKPLVVAGSGTHAVVSAASYAARAYGVRSAMPLSRARQLCPELVVVPVRFEIYRAFSLRIQKILSGYTPEIETLALDEAYLDVTGSTLRFGEPLAIATQIKAAIKNDTGLNCSIGLGPNKFIAKLCSKLAKPDGILAVDADAVCAFIADLPIESLWGVGHKTAETLSSMGCQTVADIRACDPARLSRRLGETSARRLQQLAWGLDEAPVVPGRPRKSLGHEITFDQDLYRLADAEIWLERISAELGSHLRAAGLNCAALTLKIKYADQALLTRQKSIAYTNHDRTLATTARELAKANLEPERGIRLLGLSATRLAAGAQLELFQNAAEADRLYQGIDKIRSRYGNQALSSGAALKPPTSKS